MKTFKLKDMEKGWFIGDFEPTAIKTKDFEVAYKEYSKGDKEESHVHKIAKELTLISKGRVLMNGEEYSAGDIIVLEPGEKTDFKALENSSTVVIKIPSVKGDKYLA